MMSRVVASALTILMCAAVDLPGQRAESWTATLDLRMEQAARVAYLVVGNDGHIYITHPFEPSWAVYRPDGRLIREVRLDGPRSAGFESAHQLGWLGDTLYVTDPATRRVGFFKTNGRLIRVLEVALAGDNPDGTPVTRLLADGSAVVGRPYSRDRPPRSPAVRIDRSGAVLDTIAWLPDGINSLSVDLSASSATTAQPFPDRSVVIGFAADGSPPVIVEAYPPGTPGTAWFVVTRPKAGGGTQFSTRIEYEPIEIPPDRIERAIEATVDLLMLRQTEPRAEIAAVVRRTIRAPAYEPPVRSAFVARNGSVWLERNPDDGGTRWTVLDADGGEVAVFQAPPDFRPMEADGGVVWGLVRTRAADDVRQSVTRWRIERRLP